MAPYDPIPDSPTDVDVDDEADGHGEGHYTNDDLLSPLDPHPVTRGLNRETAGHEFFSAVFLDSPEHPAEKEELEEAMFGGTRPLRMKKKVPGVRIAGVGPAARYRRSNVSSVPQSPRSPISSRGHGSAPVTERQTLATSAVVVATVPTASTIARSNTTSSTTSTLHPHHSISRIFLEGSPVPPSPPPAVPAKSPRRALLQATQGAANNLTAAHPLLWLPEASGPSRPPRPTRLPASRRGDRSVPSEMHLNLGSVQEKDEYAPGPSPPWSVTSSPLQRSVSEGTSPPLSPPAPQRERNYRRDAGRTYPPPPLTPSRAPSKAARLLGANVDVPLVFAPPRHGKKKDHFRPLPSETLVEIERFFGTVPPKPPKKPKSSSNHPGAKIKLSGAAHISGPIHLGGVGLGARNVGLGETVRHRGEDGSMWLDMEEEQEFAWLMSDSYTQSAGLLAAAHITANTDGSSGSTSTSLQALQHTEAAWGMEAFTSVLSLPKGKKGKTPGAKKKHHFGESFFDFGDDDEVNDHDNVLCARNASKAFKSSKSPNEKKVLRLAVSAKPVPFSSSTESLQVVTPTKAGTTSPSHSRATASTYISGLDDAYSSSPPRAGSPPRPKTRPPPLRLAPTVSDPRLPVISTTPASSSIEPPYAHVYARGSDIKAAAPTTPFVRPRRAPVPDQTLHKVEPVPSMSKASKAQTRHGGYISSHDSTRNSSPASTESGPGPRVAVPQVTSKAPSSLQGSLPTLSHDGRYDEEPMEISYFELDSPTDTKPPHRRGVGGRGMTGPSGSGTGQMGQRWLRKVVKPLSGAGARA